MDPKQTGKLAGSSESEDLAASFVAARRHARALDRFPGTLPTSLDDAYRCQETAIGLWPDRIGGWKVGRVPGAYEARFQTDRLAGPIFSKTIFASPDGGTLPMPVFVGGFAAIEAEFVAVVAEDAPADKTAWSLHEAAAMIADLRIGLEIASSPLAAINELGPAAVVSDFGNNAGLIVGPSIRDWQTRDPQDLTCEAFVDGISVGRGGAFLLTGGFQRSVQFMLENAAARGYPLRAGELVATGQTSGIHDVTVGQHARIEFGDDGVLNCVLEAANG